MKKTILALLIATMFSGCAVIQTTGLNETDPTVTTQRPAVKKEFDTLPSPAAGKRVSVAVYSFTDKTGQRRPQANVASLSMAVTQGADSFLIKALSDVGRGEWFEVVERGGLDNLTKERLIIRQMREAYEGANAKPLMPMQFAGIILEGGIIGYDASTTSGGAGMRIFGIGKQTQWSTDTVTVSLRAVSVNTGKVIASVTVQKTILSTADSATALKFFDNATQAFEAEAGLTINEPGTYAVKAATEMAVVELIKEGQRKGVWDFRQEVKEPPAMSFIPAPAPAPVISSEVKVEEKQNDVKPAPTNATTKTTTSSETNTETTKAQSAETTVNLKPEVSKQGLQVEPKALFGQRTLKEAEFIYKEPNDKSQKTWMFKKGSVVNVVQPGSEGWVRVRDNELRGGWIRIEKLEEVK